MAVTFPSFPGLPGLLTTPVSNKDPNSSISALTDGKFSKLDQSGHASGSYVKIIITNLTKCGYPVNKPATADENAYDFYVSEAVRKFQVENMGVPYGTGILDDDTWDKITTLAEKKLSDEIAPPDNSESSEVEDTESTSPHYRSFFDEENDKQFRQNHKNIKIIFGNSGIIKEIHDVVMRSVGVEVDTSGNPISETYEFIARDITESDEKKDETKYIGDNGKSSSDVQYVFNFN